MYIYIYIHMLADLPTLTSCTGGHLSTLAAHLDIHTLISGNN